MSVKKIAGTRKSAKKVQAVKAWDGYSLAHQAVFATDFDRLPILFRNRRDASLEAVKAYGERVVKVRVEVIK